MKRKCILIFMIVLVMGITACSSESKEDAVSVETDSPQETDQKETTDRKAEEAETNLVEPSKPEIAKAYEIVIKPRRKALPFMPLPTTPTSPRRNILRKLHHLFSYSS